MKEETEQAPSWKQDCTLGRTVDFEPYAQCLWKRHTNWKTRPPGRKSLHCLLTGQCCLLEQTETSRVFSSSSLSAIRVVSSAYLRLLIFLPAILIPACVSFSPEFLMMYSAYKLNKQGDNIQPWRTPFPIWNQSVVPCPVLLNFSF